MALTDNLIRYYKLDETSGAIVDSTGTDNATNSGAAYGATGIIGTCLDFEYADTDTLSSDSATGINGSESWSMNCWIKVESQHGGQPEAFMTIGTTGTAGHVVSIQVHNSTLNYLKWVTWGGNFGEDETIDSGVTLIGNWHMITATYDGSNSALYVDGNSTPVHTSTGKTLILDDDVWRLGWSGSAFQQFDGLIDEAGLWTRELTTAEISDLYNGGAGWTYPSAGTNFQVNVGDVWKEVSAMQVNVGDVWKEVAGVQVNVGDSWKEVF